MDGGGDSVEGDGGANTALIRELLGAVPDWDAAFATVAAAIEKHELSHRSMWFLRPLHDDLKRQLVANTARLPSGVSVELKWDHTSVYAAYVERTEECRCVVHITTGLVCALLLASAAVARRGATTAAAFEETYPEVAWHELVDNPRLRHQHNYYWRNQQSVTLALRDSPLGSALPTERWRRLLAYELTSQALHFSMLHELGHVWKSHLDWVEGSDSPARHDELSPADEAAEVLTYQLMESEADDFAATLTAAKWAKVNQVHAYSPTTPMHMGAHGLHLYSAADLFYVQECAVCILFVVIDAMRVGSLPKSAPQDGAFYPAPAYRAYRSLNLFVEQKALSRNNYFERITALAQDLQKAAFPTNERSGAESEDVLRQYDERLMEHSRGGGGELMQRQAVPEELVPLNPLPQMPDIWIHPDAVSIKPPRPSFCSLASCGCTFAVLAVFIWLVGSMLLGWGE